MLVNSVMKKILVGLGAVLLSLLLISTATAVPQAYSKPAMNIVDKIEYRTDMIESLKQNDFLSLPETGGIIDFIIQLIQMIIQFVFQLIEFISDLIQIISLIQTLIDALTTLFNLIAEFIQLIMNIFNPDLVV